MAKSNKTGGFRAFRTRERSNVRRDGEMPDASEFERLYRESYDVIYGRILFQMRNVEAAQDVTAEAFMHAARNFGRFDPAKAKFTTWMSTIARNCMIDYYRKSKINASIDDVPESLFASDDDHARDVADADLVQSLLAEIDETDRQIVCMKYCEGLQNVEIAREIGMNPSTVATRLQRALAKMRTAAGASV